MRNKYIGKWRIVEVEMWDKDFIDLAPPGQITIRKGGLGSFKFGAVRLDMDCRIEKPGDDERLEFSLEGSDEGDPVSGRGWALVQGSEMTGRIYFHLGDDSGFKATKSQ
jgi:hypothetical protein